MDFNKNKKHNDAFEKQKKDDKQNHKDHDEKVHENDHEHHEKNHDEKHPKQDLKKENSILVRELKEVQEKNEHLKMQVLKYESEIKKLQEEFIDKLKQKAREAQTLVDKKQKELDEKFSEELENKKSKIYTKEMIPIIEALEQFEIIIRTPVDDPKLANYLTGFKMILSMFESALSMMNITKEHVNIGDELDPNLMQAFELTESAGFKKNQVVEVIKHAYKYKDDVIKHAIVKVQK